MAASTKIDVMDRLLSQISLHANKLENFLSTQPDLVLNQKKGLKELYDFTKSQEPDESVGDALPELITENFDDEQIWQEIELQNEPILSQWLPDVANISAARSLTFKVESTGIKKPNKREEVKELNEEEHESGDSEGTEEEMDEEEDIQKPGLFNDDYASDESEEEIRLKNLLDKVEAQDNEGEDEDEESEEDSDFDLPFQTSDTDKDVRPKKKPAVKSDNKTDVKAKKRKTVVDDRFFKMSDMEQFLEIEDRKEERKSRKTNTEDSESDEDEEEDSDEEAAADFDVWAEDDETAMKGNSVRDMMYQDFFDGPDDDSKKVHKKQKKEKQQLSEEESEAEDSDAPDEEMDEESDDEPDEGVDEGIDEGSDEESDEGGPNANKDLFESDEGEDIADILKGQNQSSFEKRQERLHAKIHDLEEKNMSEKPWQLTGETAAASRPQNSLLQEDLDFEQQSRQAPVITEETTKVLEDIIKQRVKDKAWDDVERKIKPKDDAHEYKKRLVLDQEKSKHSLAQIYEEEYLKQANKEEEEKAIPEHEEIQKMMTDLFLKLDALSNFQFTPKPAAAEVKVVSNMPSIVMEEVQPVTMTDAQQLAPQEIKEKSKVETKGDTERTQTDKNRARKEKKRFQKVQRQNREAKEAAAAKTNPDAGNKLATKKAMKDLEKQSKQGKGVKLIKDGGGDKGTLTSSTKFFSQLQEQAKVKISKHKGSQSSDSGNKHKTSAAKLKL